MKTLKSVKEWMDKRRTWFLFDQISDRYDVMNCLMTFGLDQQWRLAMIRLIPQLGRGSHGLDLASGTLDVAIKTVITREDVDHVLAMDMSENMLAVGQKKRDQLRLQSKISIQVGDACQIPCDDAQFDFVTMSFGIRNVEDYSKALFEILRCLKPEGALLILETSVPENGLLRTCHRVYMDHVMPKMACLITGQKTAYDYLGQSAQQFPSGQAFLDELKKVGFERVSRSSRCLGAVSIYMAHKQALS